MVTSVTEEDKYKCKEYGLHFFLNIKIINYIIISK